MKILQYVTDLWTMNITFYKEKLNPLSSLMTGATYWCKKQTAIVLVSDRQRNAASQKLAKPMILALYFIHVWIGVWCGVQICSSFSLLRTTIRQPSLSLSTLSSSLFSFSCVIPIWVKIFLLICFHLPQESKFDWVNETSFRLSGLIECHSKFHFSSARLKWISRRDIWQWNSEFLDE